MDKASLELRFTQKNPLESGFVNAGQESVIG
jgi:hypothetical protein